jgi:hypothetical protein
MQRREVALSLRRPRRGGATVLLLHGVAVAGALLIPFPGATARQADRDERRPQVVGAHPQAVARALKQLRAIDLRPREVVAKLSRQVVDVQADALVVEEHACVGGHLLPKMLAPDRERHEHVRTHVPGAGPVGLVLVEVETIVHEVDVRPRESRQFVGAQPLSVENPVREPPEKRYVGAGHEGSILVRVQALLRLVPAGLRQPAAGNRRHLDPLPWIDRKVHEARHDLRDVPARSRRELRRQVRHDVLRVAKRELVEPDLLDVRQDVKTQELLVALGRTLVLDVIRKAPCDLAVGPIFREVLEGRDVRHGLGGALTERIDSPEEGVPRSARPRLRTHRDELANLVGVPCAAQTQRDNCQSRCALLGGGLTRAGWQREVVALAALDRDPRGEAARETPEFTCG